MPVGTALPIRLRIDNFVVDNLHSGVLNIVHFIHPCHHVVSFQHFRYALIFRHSPCQVVKHLLRLSLHIGKVGLKLTDGQKIVVQHTMVFFSLPEVVFLCECADKNFEKCRERAGKHISVLLGSFRPCNALVYMGLLPYPLLG